MAWPQSKLPPLDTWTVRIVSTSQTSVCVCLKTKSHCAVSELILELDADPELVVEAEQSRVPNGQLLERDCLLARPNSSIFAVQEDPWSIRNGVKSDRPPVSVQHLKPDSDDSG